ncbi:MAG: TAXI family TRAP transporter solute-binding subunit [Gammaproteobacteria bacterium]|nr:TAXI family TRAP transporter solute-binding subunit [Gammaproteobacteria bacterium]NIR88338.1 TAXI family TRAP transporter solute-binding subunit [Gammaproteobacteria bacterium]NIU06118.1 TAXI family TRAP transporter solute-binding subunit [Gammaproteobacteria bacterium]NIV73537.1 TAXI family TRAP transporter solute-binding subunit [Gammaproteobacteria bacterium]NIX87391.1 TAXI family TRAP transporter solute-binding subunit [Gammaproteobacteria bacterium]
MRGMRATLLICMLGAGMSPLASAAEAADVRFATCGLGSSWYNYGAGIGELAKANLPAGSSVSVLPVACGVGNVKLIQQGEAELGMSFPTATKPGCEGRAPFEAKQDKVRGVLGGLDTYYFGAFVTAKSGITSWDQIVSGDRKVRLITAKVGGTGEQTVRQVLDAYGVDYEFIEAQGGSVKSLKRAATSSAVADGRADMWAHIVTKGHPAATELTTVNQMRVLPLSGAVIEKMKAHGFVPATLPAGTFPGQSEAVQTIKTATNVISRPGVSDEVVYAFTKAIVENDAKLGEIHAALTQFDPKSAADPALNGGCPLHPGAVRYYKEAGLM